MGRSWLIGVAAAAWMFPTGGQGAPTAPRAPAQSSARPPAKPAQPAPPQQVQIPPPAGLLILVKSSLIALNQANQTGNYQVLYALGSDALRAQTDPQKLGQSFAAFRQRQIDFSPIIFLSPQFTQQPKIEGGRLHLVGFFPTTPLRISFDFWFEPSQGQWKFIQLNTSLVPPAQGQAPSNDTPPKPAGR